MKAVTFPIDWIREHHSTIGCALIRLLCGTAVRWEGSEPSNAQRIYFANHTSHLDFLVLWSALSRDARLNTRPVGAADYWSKGRVRPYLAHKWFQIILLDREVKSMHRHPLEPIAQALDDGDSIIFFPEGTRNIQGEIQPFKAGLYHLAKRYPQVEMIPVYLENLNRILPKGEILPVPLLSTVAFGAPLRLESDESRERFLERARESVLALRHTPPNSE
jgi:1-acyl-sn-glycerol-3-phosphate acyltransferase